MDADDLQPDDVGVGQRVALIGQNRAAIGLSKPALDALQMADRHREHAALLCQGKGNERPIGVKSWRPVAV